MASAFPIEPGCTELSGRSMSRRTIFLCQDADGIYQWHWLLCCFTVPTWGPWKNSLHLPRGDYSLVTGFGIVNSRFRNARTELVLLVSENGQTVLTIVSFASAHQIQGTIRFEFSVVVKIFVTCEVALGECCPSSPSLSPN